MTTATLPYDLPDLRPFRAIQNRMRIQGGSVVTGSGVLQSENYDGTDVATGDSTQGWRLEGAGDSDLNDVRVRGELIVTGLSDVDPTEVWTLTAAPDSDQVIATSAPAPALLWDGTDLLTPAGIALTFGSLGPALWLQSAIDDLTHQRSYISLEPGVFGAPAFDNSAPSIVLGADTTRASHLAAERIRVGGNYAISALPFAFDNDPDTGLYRKGANVLGLVAGGSPSLLLTANAAQASLGSAAAPSLTFQGDTNTGIYRYGANAIGFALGGTYRARLASQVAGTGGAAGYTLYLPNMPTTTGGSAQIYRHTDGSLYRMISKRAAKRDIRPLGPVGEWFDRLRPVVFRSKPEHVPPGVDPDLDIVGFIAEDVDEVSPLLATHDDDGATNNWSTQAMVAALVAEVQSLRQRVAQLEAAA